MIQVGLGQLLAAILLFINGIILLNDGGWLMPIVDIFAALWFFWIAFDRIDPPSRFNPQTSFPS